MAYSVYSQNFGTANANISTVGFTSTGSLWTLATPLFGGASNAGLYISISGDIEDAISPTISIAGYSNMTASLAVGVFASDQDADTIKIYYSLDNGSWILLQSFLSITDIGTHYVSYNIPIGNTLRFKFSADNTVGGLGVQFGVDYITVTADNYFHLKDTPQQYEPAHNDLTFVISGSNNVQSNYKYWCDVYFTGSTAYDYRLFTFPRPDGFGFFNLKTIIRDYVSGDLDIPAVETFYRNSDMYKAYNVYFGESYGSTGAISSGITSSGTYYAYDGSLEWSEFISYSQNTRAVNSTTTLSKFLTNRPQAEYSVYDFTTQNTLIGDSENAWVYFAVKASDVAYAMTIVTLDASLNIVGTYTINNPYVTLSSDDNRFLRFPSGTANMSRIPSGDVNCSAIPFISTLPIIKSNVKYYILTITNSGGVSTSETMGYEIRSNCSKYNTYRLHYKNKWGGFDSFTFTMVNKESGDIERKSYKKQYGTISSAGNWAYTKKDRGITNYSTKSKRKLRLTSDWVTEAQYELLIELIESPQVYCDDSGELHAVNIINTSYDVKTLKNDKLFNLEIEVEFTQMNRRQ